MLLGSCLVGVYKEVEWNLKKRNKNNTKTKKHVFCLHSWLSNTAAHLSYYVAYFHSHSWHCQNEGRVNPGYMWTNNDTNTLKVYTCE